DLVATILRSQHFYSDYAYRQRVKPPVEHVIGLVRVARPGFAPRDLAPWLEQMGQSLFAPPNVKGWSGGKSWLNSATVLARQNFAESLAGPHSGSSSQKVTPGDAPPPPDQPAPADSSEPLIGLLKRDNCSDAAAVIELLADLFLNGDVVTETRAKLVAFLAEGSPEGAGCARRGRR